MKKLEGQRTSLKDVRGEVKKELGMRLKVWGKVERMSLERKRRYEILSDLAEVLEQMSVAEYNRFVKRVADAKASVQTLF